MTPQLREIIHCADKYARRREHSCLYPGCKRTAIKSHAISRSSMLEALADKGVVYTQPCSFVSMMRMKSPAEPIEVTEVGVNQAGVFKGYCSKHDSSLFVAADTIHHDTIDKMVVALHLRALSLEFSRNRLIFDFAERLRELGTAKGLPFESLETAEGFTKSRELITRSLSYFFVHARAGMQDGITFFAVPVPPNLMVSCCGVFGHQTGGTICLIGYNVVSLRDFSLLVLTTFASTRTPLNTFLLEFGHPIDLERLINCVAFSKGEEPLIAPRLWNSLSKGERLQVREALRPPAIRASTAIPKVVKASRDDVRTATPEVWERFLRTLRRI